MSKNKFVVRGLTWYPPRPTKDPSTGDTSRSSCSIEHLSNEVLLIIFAYCGPFTVAQCTRVNRRWNRLGNARLDTNSIYLSSDEGIYATLFTTKTCNQLLRRISPVVRCFDVASLSYSIIVNGPFPPFSRLVELKLGLNSIQNQRTVLQIVSSCQETLRSLTLDSTKRLTKRFAKRLAPYLTNLHSLFLTYSFGYTRKDDEFECTILLLRAPKELRNLRLPSDLKSLHFPIVQELIRQHLKTLEYLELQGSQFDREGLFRILGDLNVQTNTLSPSPLKLKRLHLSLCQNPYGATIWNRLRGSLTNLTYIDLSSWKDATGLSQFFRWTPKIEKISAWNMKGITDEVLLCIMHSCRYLKELNISDNTELTTSVLWQFIRSAPDSLRVLDLTRTSCVTDSVILELLNLSRKRSWEMFTKDPKNYVCRCNITFYVSGCKNLTSASSAFFFLQLSEFYLVRPGEIVVGSWPLASSEWFRKFSGFLSTDIQDASQFTSVVTPCYPHMSSSLFLFRDPDSESLRRTRLDIPMLMIKTLIEDIRLRKHLVRPATNIEMESLLKQYLANLTTFQDARFAICGFDRITERVFGDQVEAVLDGLGIKLAYEGEQENVDIAD